MGGTMAYYKKYTKEELEQRIRESSSYIDCLVKMGYSRNCGHVMNKFKEFLLEQNIVPTHFAKKNIVKYTFENTFCENSLMSRQCIKKHIIQNNLLPYKCDICTGEPTWNGQPLVLILDHINGIFNDNRLINLRFMCPNCNSQQDTFAGKNKTHKKSSLVQEFNNQAKDNIFFINKEIIIKELPNCRTLTELRKKTGLPQGLIQLIKEKEKINIDFFFTGQHLKTEIVNSFKQDNDIQKIIKTYRLSYENTLNILINEGFSIENITYLNTSSNSKHPRLKYNEAEMTDKIIKLLIKYRTMKGAATELGISDNALKKRCKYLKIDYKTYFDLSYLKKEIIEFVQQNSLGKALKHFKTSEKTIHKIFKNSGVNFIPINKQYSLTRQERATIVRKIKNGEMLISISKELKLPYGLIKKINRQIKQELGGTTGN